MLNFKEYLVESQQPLWREALYAKPEKYGTPFADKVNDKFAFPVLDGNSFVTLQKNGTVAQNLLKVLSGQLSKEGLVDNLRKADPNEKVFRMTPRGKGWTKPEWKIAGTKNDYIELNTIKKDAVTGVSTPTGGEWESLISVGYNIKKLGNSNFNSPKKYNIEEYGIDQKTYDNVVQPFWGKWNVPSIAIGTAFYNKLNKNITMTQFGSGSATLNQKWKDWGGKKPTPKTDMYLGKDEKFTAGYRISLKKVGGGQLMSAAKGESIATFNAALEYMGEDKTGQKEIEDIIDQINKEFRKIELGGSITDLKKAKGFASTMTSKEIKAKEKEIKQGDIAHGELSKNITTFFNENQKIKEFFTFEAASGYKKFSNNIGTADLVMEFDPVGKSKITQYREFGNSKLSGKIAHKDIHKNIIDLSKKTQFFVAFKTGKINPFSALRTKTIKNEEFENIEDVPTLRNLIIDHIESNELTRTFLPENFEQLDEFALLDRAIQGIKRGASKIKSSAKDIYLNLTVRIKNFLEGLFKKVGIVLNKIKKLAGKALHALLKFFGFEIDKVTSSGPSLIFANME
jgi:hypothetical protein